MLLHFFYKIKKSIKNAKKKLHGRCTFDALFVFSQNLLISRKMEKKLRKFFPISKFTKLVNLLVLETQGCIPVQATRDQSLFPNALQAIHHGNVKTCWKGHHCVWSDWMG